MQSGGGRAGTPSRQQLQQQGSGGGGGGGGGEDYYDEDDFLDDYTHERLPTAPAQLDLELPESDLDLTMTFNSIIAEGIAAAEKEE